MANEESSRHEEKKDHHHHGHAMIHIIIIVNGVPARIEVAGHDTLMVAAEKALQATHNIGRPITDWEMKNGDNILPLSEKIDKLGIKDDDELFLSLKAGVGGLR